MRVIAIIPAGGKGKRSGTETPKQYFKFHSKELITYTLEVFQKNNLVDEIIISAEPTSVVLGIPPTRSLPFT